MGPVGDFLDNCNKWIVSKSGSHCPADSDDFNPLGPWDDLSNYRSVGCNWGKYYLISRDLICIIIYIYKSNSSNIWSYNHSHTNTYLELKWPLFWYFWLEKALFWEVSLPNIEGIGGSDGDGGVSRSQTSPSCCSVDHPQHVDPLDLGVSSAKPSDPPTRWHIQAPRGGLRLEDHHGDRFCPLRIRLFFDPLPNLMFLCMAWGDPNYLHVWPSVYGIKLQPANTLFWIWWWR